MTVNYKKDGKDKQIKDAIYVDTFMTENGHNTAVITKYNRQEIEIDLKDLVSIVDY